MNEFRKRGFTLIEILVVITIIGVLAGMVSLLIGPSRHMTMILQCQKNLVGLTGLLEAAHPSRYPSHSGPDFVLYLVAKGSVVGQDQLEGLFCPGDMNESFEDAGGEQAYADLDLAKSGSRGHLTSYAGRDQKTVEHRAKKGAGRTMVLLADDSEDHHDGKGIVVGLTGGIAKWRDKVDRYKMSIDDPLEVGPNSTVEELKALIAE
ncbi:MAG: type II secretion system protein [Planctomycetota bacterium]|nr:type II secretion system protein [Planctomycetota bacterium]